MTIRKQLGRLIEMNYAEQWVPNHIAFQILVNRYGDRLISELIEALADDDAEVRLLATELLDEANAERAAPAIPSLVEMLSDDDLNVVVTAVLALKRLSHFARSALPALKLLMRDKDEYLQIVAAATIGKISPEDPSTIPILVAGLDSSNPVHRASSCEFLGDRLHSAALNTMNLFGDSNFTVRFAATKAYSRFTGDWLHAVAVCVEMLKDDNETNRVMASACLLSIRHYVGDHLDLLKMALNDVSWQARIDIEQVLYELRKQ